VFASCFSAFSACVNTVAFWITLHALPLGYREIAPTDPVAAWLKSESFRLGYMHEALIIPVLFAMYYVAPRPIYSAGIACTFGLDALHDFLLVNLGIALPVMLVYTPLILAWGAGAAEYTLTLIDTRRNNFRLKANQRGSSECVRPAKRHP
jgi:hypothetical protein